MSGRKDEWVVSKRWNGGEYQRVGSSEESF